MSKFSIKKPYMVFVGVILIIILGIISFMNLSTDLLPNMELPYVAIVTTYVGASPEKIEESVSKVIEQGMMGISNIENVSSTSSENYSMVMLEFSGDSDMNSIMIEISQALDLIESNFEDGVSTPIVMQINPNMMPVLLAGIDKKDTDIITLTKFVNDEIVPELESVEGVAQVELYGEVEDEIKISLDQSKIDDVNDKVLAKVSSELYKTKKDLDKASKELEDGQQELANTKNENTKKIADGLAQVETGRNEITKAEIELANNEKSLKEKKTELEKEQSKIPEGSKQNLEELLGAYNSKENIEAQIKANNEKITEYNTIISNLQNELAAESDPVKQAELNASIVENQNNLSLKNAENTDLNTTLSGINSMLSMPGVLSKDDATQNLNGILALEQGLAQINSAMVQIAEGKKEIGNKKEELNMAYASLEVAQSTLVSETTKAETKLDIAKQQLDDGLKQFEDARAKAYDQASLDGVITASMISGILTAENFSMPAGYINDDIIVKIGDKFTSLEEIENLVIFSFDIKGLEEVKLKDLANIEVTNNKDDIYTKINNSDALVLSFSKQSTSSTKDVSKAILEKFDDLKEKYPDIEITNVMDQGVYIDMIIGSVMNSLIIGGFLAVIILFIFLKDFRPTIIVAISIPISLVFAVVLMYFSGISINIMSLSGLALGVGMLVDNSIVVVENIYRLKKEGKSIKIACIDGAKKVTGAIIASTLTTICVFLPIVFVHGLSRQLFQDIGLTIAYSLIASLLAALTVVPAFSSKLLNNVTDKENNTINKITDFYVKVLEKALKYKIIVIAIVVVLLGISIYLMTRMEIEFVPEVLSDQMELSFEMEKDTSNEELRDMATQIADKIMDIEGISKVGCMDMSGSSGLNMMGGSGVSVYLILDEERTISNQEIADKIKENTKDLNCTINVLTSTMDMSAMMESGVSITVKGTNIDTIKNIARDVEKKLSEVDGIGEIEGVDSETTTSGKFIDIDKNKAMKYGLTVAQVYQKVADELTRKIKGTKVELDTKEYQLLIEKPKESELNLDNIMDYKIDAKENNEDVVIKLKDIASISDEETLDVISRKNNSRYVTVKGLVKEGYSATQVSREVEKLFENYEVEDGYDVELSGEIDSIMEYMKDLLLMLFVAILFIYLIMVAQFQSFKLPFIVIFTMPLAFTGGILALYLTGQSISIIAMLGFLVLAGVVVNNGIVFIDSINQLREEGIERTDSILLTGKLRLRPILMTALTTILGMFAMALGIGKGAEMSQPLGIVTIGGLLYATLLTLFLCPVLYDILCKKTIISNLDEDDSFIEIEKNNKKDKKDIDKDTIIEDVEKVDDLKENEKNTKIKSNNKKKSRNKNTKKDK